jgi:hypothetical protein
MMARLAMIFYWCSMAITFMCEIAALAILGAIATDKIIPDLEIWMAAVFFAVIGGVS